MNAVPRDEDGKVIAPSVFHLARDMRRGDLVSVMLQAFMRQEEGAMWLRNWVREGAGRGLKVP